MEYAQGELGLPPEQFYDLTWDEYGRAVRGYQVRQDREWERTRLLGVQMVNLLAEKPITPKQYMWLSTDEPDPEPDTPVETQEEFWARMARENFYQAPAPLTGAPE